MATSNPAPEGLIRKVDDLLEAVGQADRELDDAFNVLYGLDNDKRWDGYIISSDGPLAIVAANLSYLHEELARLAMDLRTVGVE